MDFLTQEKFQFVSRGLPPDTFAVISFTGSEGFSKPYEFEINLVATDAEVDMNKVLQNPAVFTLLRNEGDIPFHGILAQFEQLHMVDQYVFYRAVLVPRLWWLSLTRHNQVFLNKTAPQIIAEVLEDGGLSPADFEMRLEKDYPPWEYVCQYRESHLDFVSRWMERDGLYYYFEQTDSGEKMIVTDTRMVHLDMPQGKTMYYAQPSGLDETHREEIIHSLVCRQKMLPQTLRLRDYNYRTPSAEVTGAAEVLDQGRGEIYLYGEHFKNSQEGDNLARIRAEEYRCQEKRFYGESTIPYLRPGYTYDLDDHYREGFNQTYLTVELNHAGNQTAYLTAGIQKGLAEIEQRPYYQNNFSAIPANVQFRPQRLTPKARFYGTMNAKIDAAGSGQYAELDEQGRYKVILPFDLSGRKDGKASAYLRMAQPYAGTHHGMHFPLHKGAEVILTFIDGDPDRPMVAAAVPNPETLSPVTATDQTMSKITTAGGNKIHIEDREGQQRMLYQSPTANTWMRLGAPNDPPAGDEEGGNGSEEGGGEDKKNWETKTKEEGFGFSTSASADWWIGANLSVEIGGAANTFIAGLEDTVIVGGKNEQVFGEEYIGVLGASIHAYWPWDLHFSPAHTHMHNEVNKIHGIETRIADQGLSIYANAQHINTERLRITANTNDIAADRVRITANEDDIADSKYDIRMTRNSMVAAHNRITNNLTSIRANKTAINANKTAINTNKTDIATNKTDISDSIDVIGMNVNNISSLTNVVSGMMNIM